MGQKKMPIFAKRIIVLAVIVIVAAILGRLAVRVFLNLLMGGTLFGGNFL
ncbi:MAG: hypothetical protein ACI3W5_14300 [Faecousia sp.]